MLKSIEWIDDNLCHDRSSSICFMCLKLYLHDKCAFLLSVQLQRCRVIKFEVVVLRRLWNKNEMDSIIFPEITKALRFNIIQILFNVTGWLKNFVIEWSCNLCNLFFCRRIKEISENNIKRFTDERKRLKIRQSKQIEKLFQQHQQMMEKFLQECKKVIHVDHCVLKPFRDFILVWRGGCGVRVEMGNSCFNF